MTRWMILVVVALSACTHTPPTTTPQAQIAHYGTDVIESVNAFQALVVQASSGATPALSVAQATPIMNTIRQVLLDAQQLSAALKLYDAALGPDRQTTGQRVLTLLNVISGSGLSTLATNLPPGVAAEGAKLIGNITTTVATVKAALAASHITASLVTPERMLV